jgi:hypothetical protein
MIPEFIARFDANRDALRAKFKERHPQSYKEIVTEVVRIVGSEDDYYAPSTERIVEIDHGSYQGTLLYVIGAGGYQPDDYWFVRVGYGSCSGCDTLQGISGYSDDPPTDEQANDYLTLALHVAQGIKKMAD